MAHLQTDIYSQVCLFVQLIPEVRSVQQDPKYKSTSLLLQMHMFSDMLVSFKWFKGNKNKSVTDTVSSIYLLTIEASKSLLPQSPC